MTTPAHPDPERLAALAGADSDALADRQLGAHVAACETCGRQVRDLTALRSALAELPDLVPSRPLQLVPPVAEPAPSAGWRIAFRRGFAPVAVAGMVLLLVGGVGATGVLGPADAGALFERLQLAAPAAPETLEGAAAEPEESASQSATDSAMAPDAVSASPEGTRNMTGSAPAESPSADEGTVPTDSTAQVIGESGTGHDGDLAVIEDRVGWVAAALLGVGLLGLAFVLRRSAARVEPGTGR